MIQKKKKQIRLIILIMIIAILITGGVIWFLQSNNQKKYANETGYVEEKIDFSSKALVVVTDGELQNTYNALESIKTYNGKYVLKYNTEEDTEKAYEELKHDSSIKDVYVDIKLKTQNYEMMSIKYNSNGKTVESWGTYAMGLNETQDKINSHTEKQEIVVAVIDSGFDLTNTILTEQNLISRIDTRYKNFLDNSNNITESHTIPHGTHVGGIILDSTPNNVKILPLQVVDESGDSTLEITNSAMRYAIDQNVDVINLSLANYFKDEDTKNPTFIEMKNLIDEAIQKNITIIAGVGNGDENGNRMSCDNAYPAAFENVIGVGALQTDMITEATIIDTNELISAKNTKTSNLSYTKFSNYGSVVDFTAPGQYIISLGTNSNKYAIIGGTSQATPYVSAAVATIKSYNKNYTNEQIMDALKTYTVDLGIAGRDNDYGEGMICFKNYEECTCGCEECDKIYCTGCLCEDCKYHTKLTKILEKIEITTKPNKTTYTVGEKFDATGMVVTAIYSDDSTETVTDYTYTTTTELTETDTTITVKYEGKTATLNIEVNSVTLSKIEVTKNPNKMVYTEGEKFNPVGMQVTATYSDNSQKVLDFYEYEPKGNLTKNDTVITITYEQKVTTLNITVNEKETEKTLSKIEITTKPNKTTYTEGERFDPEGMVITAVYSDNSREIITNYTYEPAGILSVDNTSITIKYNNKTVNLDITVDKATEPKTLEKIEVTNKPNKTTYTVGEKFDATGMVVTAIYSDGTTEAITDYIYTPTEALTESNKKIEIVYKGKTASVNIEVKSNIIQKTLSKIEITTNPNKTTYTVGEKFDATGMVVTAIYSDGTKAIINNYSCFPVTALTANHTKITVSYTEEGTTLTTTLPIEVQTKNNTSGNNQTGNNNSSNSNNNNSSNNNNQSGNNNIGNVTNGTINNNSQMIQIQDNTIKNSNLANTGVETYIIPIVIIAIIGGIAFIKYRQYKEI